MEDTKIRTIIFRDNTSEKLLNKMNKWSEDHDGICQLKQITNVNTTPDWAVLALINCKRNMQVVKTRD